MTAVGISTSRKGIIEPVYMLEGDRNYDDDNS